MTLARRHLLRFASALTFVRAAPSLAEEPVTVRMRSDADGGHVGFDPVGLLIQPGRAVRFLCEANYHTTSAYHPANAAHSLRIPRTAQPWSSDGLQPGDVFEVTLSTPGVYDYFCVPHEEAGDGWPPHRRPSDWARQPAVRLV
jgi:plastocyanin